VRPPLPDTPLQITSLENLDEITVWLGTFRERLRIAHPKDQPKLDATMVVVLAALVTVLLRRQAPVPAAARGEAGATADTASA
jgi:hypothetical protein